MAYHCFCVKNIDEFSLLICAVNSPICSPEHLSHLGRAPFLKWKKKLKFTGKGKKKIVLKADFDKIISIRCRVLEHEMSLVKSVE